MQSIGTDNQPSNRRRIAFWGLLALGALATAVYWADQLSQPVWEVRIEGTAGLPFEVCLNVTTQEWWIPHRGRELLTAAEVPSRYEFRAVDYDAMFTPLSSSGSMRVTVLRNGVVDSEYEFEPGSEGQALIVGAADHPKP